MWYLITEIFIYLLFAFLMGLVFGWAITHLVHMRKLASMEKLARINYMSLEQELQDTKSALQYAQSGHFNANIPKPQVHDDLKIISGIGPVLERHLNKLGIFTFKQIANLSRQDLEWLSSTLEDFSDRIERENWVAQAKELLNKEMTN